MKIKTIIITILVCLIVIVGIIIWKNFGFNLELQNSTRNQIYISNTTGINKKDVEEIIQDVLGNQKYFVQEVETFGNTVAIVAEEINDEQKEQIVKKFNEKYETKIDSKDIETVTIPFTRIIDIIKPFIIPGIVTFGIVLIYLIFRFKSIGLKEVIAKIVITPIIGELLLYSIIAITRIPFGRIAVACGIGLYVIIIAILTNKFENIMENKDAEKQKTERIG